MIGAGPYIEMMLEEGARVVRFQGHKSRIPANSTEGSGQGRVLETWEADRKVVSMLCDFGGLQNTGRKLSLYVELPRVQTFVYISKCFQ